MKKMTLAARRVALFGLAPLVLAACALAPTLPSAPPSSQPATGAVPPKPPAPPTPPAPPAPEGASARVEKPGWFGKRHLVAAANPMATAAGDRILRAGGSALDAAVAVQMVLTLVEPQSSGIGGGAFLMHWNGQSVSAWDGREVAPMAADGKLFLMADGKPMPFMQAVVGGRSVGVPGVLPMLEAAHREHGRLPWAKLFEPAIELAEGGFPMPERLHTLLAAEQALKTDGQASAYFYQADGRPRAAGSIIKNPALAAVFKAVATGGSAAFMRGAVADDIVRRVRSHPSNPGVLSAADLAAYKPVRREAICTDWRERHRICGFPPPSSGHLAIMQIMGMLDLQQAPTLTRGQASVELIGQQNLPKADWLHRYLEASRLAFADRAMFVADPAFVDPPAGAWTSLLAKPYLTSRAALIGDRSMGVAMAGAPTQVSAHTIDGQQLALAPRWGAMPDQPERGTSHISIVDAQGNALAMTTTIEAGFGARIMSDGGTGLPGGFLLNNELTDFSLAPVDAQGRPIANRVEPGKRPRSSMSPTLVFDRRDNRLVMSVGSPGGAAIIHYTARALIGSLDWGLNLQQVFAMPHAATYNGPTLLEKDRWPAATAEALRARGHTVNLVDLVSGLQGIQRVEGGWFGAADPRREGIVAGE